MLATSVISAAKATVVKIKEDKNEPEKGYMVGRDIVAYHAVEELQHAYK